MINFIDVLGEIFPIRGVMLCLEEQRVRDSGKIGNSVTSCTDERRVQEVLTGMFVKPRGA